MKRILTWKEYQTILRAFREKYPKAKSSNLLMPGEAAAALERGALYAHTDAGTLTVFILDRRIGHAYVTRGSAAEGPIPWDEPFPCILDEPIRISDPREKPDSEKWNDLGFEYRTTHIQMVWKPDNPDEICPGETVFASGRITEEMCGNWYAYLDTVALTVPDEPRPCREGETAYCIQDPEGRIACQILCTPGRKTGALHMLVTVPEYRGQGLAKDLLRGVFRHQYREYGVEKLLLWVETGNESAIRCYTGLGFAYNGTVSRQYILPAG